MAENGYCLGGTRELILVIMLSNNRDLVYQQVPIMDCSDSLLVLELDVVRPRKLALVGCLCVNHIIDWPLVPEKHFQALIYLSS